MSISSHRHALGVFSLAMITAGSVDSIRNLPATALFGSSLIFFFILGAVLFLFPSALVSAELASTSRDEGGVYAWVKNAFGLQAGFLAIWFQWFENVIWYPTILSFIAATIGYLISPALAQNKTFLITVILVSFWGMTFINLCGIKSSARFSNFCTIAGLLIPMTLIISLGVAWIFLGKPIQISFHSEDLLPHLNNTGMWVALTGIMLSFCGMEIATIHAPDVRNPQQDYPRALFIATLIIVFTLMSASLSIALVLPQKDISLVAGIMQAFNAFFGAYHLEVLLPLVALMLVIGGMGGVNNWIIAPTRGLTFALKDLRLYPKLCSQNRFGAPHILLISQAVIVSLMAMAFLLIPTINGSYWLLTALTSQVYMLMYILMFAAAIRLRYKKCETRSGFIIPGGYFGIWVVSGAGLIGSIVTFAIGFIPPTNIQVGNLLRYESFLMMGLLAICLPPVFLYASVKNNLRH